MRNGVGGVVEKGLCPGREDVRLYPERIGDQPTDQQQVLPYPQSHLSPSWLGQYPALSKPKQITEGKSQVVLVYICNLKIKHLQGDVSVFNTEKQMPRLTSWSLSEKFKYI